MGMRICLGFTDPRQTRSACAYRWPRGVGDAITRILAALVECPHVVDPGPVFFASPIAHIEA
jgi:hypothetical protein